jgi:hypothetical protein
VHAALWHADSEGGVARESPIDIGEVAADDFAKVGPLGAKAGSSGYMSIGAKSESMRLREQSARGGVSFVELFAEVFRILSRAQSAAHTYQVLSTASDAQLAVWGLRRRDVSRAVFHTLTQGRRPDA